MALNFQSFKGAQQANVPALADATARQGEMDAARHAAKVAMQRKNAAGGIQAYDKFTGKDTPIRDYLMQAIDGVENPMEANAIPVEDQSIYSNAQGDILGESGVDQYDSMDNLNAPMTPAPVPSELPMGFDAATGAVDPALQSADALPMGFDTATGAVDPALQAGDLSAALRDGGTFDASGVPVLSALTGVNQLAQGDIGGAAGTGTKAALASLGPWGIAGALGLGLLGV